MSYPGPIIPPVFSTENLKDDDGAVIDSFFIETDAPPVLKDATQTIDKSVTPPIKPLSKVLTKHQLIDPQWGQSPVQLLPGDARRQGVGIRVYSPTLVATDGIRLASDIGEVNSAGIILHGQVDPSNALNNHTGPLYAIGYSIATGGINSALLYVEVWAVTE